MITTLSPMRLAVPGNAPSGAVGARLWFALFLLAAALFLFVDGRVPPIALPDESRNAINALEMHLSGFSLVTTYDFAPDLWNTKPPLLIWLMSASMGVFGPSEWAIRLPSALAALGILLCTLLFVRRVTRSTGLALLTAGLLVISPGFFGEHGARTADFDATLTFFVTAGLQLLFLALHKARPGAIAMIAVGALVGAGALTKTIAAFIPVAGVVAYCVAVGRLGRTLANADRYLLAAAFAVIPLLAFYALREAAAPGYVANVMYNDLAGRFTDAQIRPSGPFYYVTELFAGWIAAGPVLLALPLVLPRLPARSRLLAIYAAAITLVALAVLSAASNRALQYALPLFPWLAILGAFALRYLARAMMGARREGNGLRAGLLGLLLAMLAGQAVYNALDWRYRRFPERDYYAQSSYGDLFAALAARGIDRFTVVDPGRPHLGKPGYQPLLRWNRLVWERRGLAIGLVSETPATPAAGPLVTCEPQVAATWPAAGREAIGLCTVLWPAARG